MGTNCVPLYSYETDFILLRKTEKKKPEPLVTQNNAKLRDYVDRIYIIWAWNKGYTYKLTMRTG